MAPDNRLDDLTAREREVLDLVRLGLTNDEIAGRLGITEAGIKYHVSQILSKLGVTTREEAVAVALAPRRHWWAALPLAAKAVGVVLMVAALAGLALLAWGVLRTSGDIAGSDGEIVFVSDRSGDHEIWVVDADGENLRQVSELPPMNFDPALSPDGRTIVFVHSPGGDESAELYLMKSDGSDARQLTHTPSSWEKSPSFLPDGQTIVYTRNGALYSIGANGNDERPLAEQASSVDVSPDGSMLAYAFGPIGRHYDAPVIVVRNLEGGGSHRLTDEMEYTATPAWSPDGGRIAMECAREAIVSFPDAPTPADPVGVCVVDADGSNLRKILDWGSHPTWSPDGQWIAFVGGVDGISLIRPDGTGLHQIVACDCQVMDPSWSPR
ncbi:MAG TPA: LuxR C-terminal-related transcriptional regulator [Dehalococcoidia bacterium]|nr:LuxR C-terminal-related transcriptional regulator [Dehalococcoidia bacterium]